VFRRSLLAFVVACAAAGLVVPLWAGGNPIGGLELLKDYEARRSSSSDPDWHNGNADARPIAPGETLVIADLEGPGRIVHIWNTVSAQDRWYSRLLVLRMYWDGEKEPSVEVPLGDFFAAGHGMDVPVNSLPVRVTSEGRARNCYWPMPFRKSARITVTNEGKGRVNAFYYYVDWQKLKSLPKDTAYFHAQYRQQVPCKPDGKNYVILEAEGRGHYVGTVQSVRLNEPGWYGEGDDFFFIDGEEEPSLRGTGTEDYFCDAWGFRKLDGLYYGLPIWEGYNTGDRSTAYRWHIPDPIPFHKSLRVEIEHKGSRQNVSGFIERYDDFYTVAYWYQTEPHKPFPPLPPARERLPYDESAIRELDEFLPGATAEPKEALGIQEGHGRGGRQVFFTPRQPGGSFTLKVPVPEAGTYEAVLFATISWDYGIYQVSVGGKPAGGPRDFFTGGTGMREFNLGHFELPAGDVEISFRNTGKNPESKGYYLGVDGILLRKVK